MDDKTKESLKDIFRILTMVQNEIAIVEKRVQMLENTQRMNDREKYIDRIMRY